MEWASRSRSFRGRNRREKWRWNATGTIGQRTTVIGAAPGLSPANSGKDVAVYLSRGACKKTHTHTGRFFFHAFPVLLESPTLIACLLYGGRGPGGRGAKLILTAPRREPSRRSPLTGRRRCGRFLLSPARRARHNSRALESPTYQRAPGRVNGAGHHGTGPTTVSSPTP